MRDATWKLDKLGSTLIVEGNTIEIRNWGSTLMDEGCNMEIK
jgi:hypothetical protein